MSSITKKLVFKKNVVTGGVLSNISSMDFFFAKKLNKEQYCLVTDRLSCLMHIIDCWLHIHYGKQFRFFKRCNFKWPAKYSIFQKDRIHIIVTSGNSVPNHIVKMLQRIVHNIEKKAGIKVPSTIKLISGQDSSTWLSLDLHKDWFKYPVNLHGLLLITRYIFRNETDDFIDPLIDRLSIAFLHRQLYHKALLEGLRSRRKNLIKLVDVCHGFLGFENVHNKHHSPIKLSASELKRIVKDSTVYCSKTN